MDSIIKNKAGIYLHIPFCKKKCLYCDFYSKEDFQSYMPYVLREIELYAPLYSNYCFDTLYIGGGTPSLLKERALHILWRQLEKYHLLDSLEEITIEVNPESFNQKKASFYKSLGINRLSIGIQSWDDAILQKLGRITRSYHNHLAVEIAAKYFENYSLDLIYGIPGQDIEKELSFFIHYSPAHISCYCLTIAHSTPLFLERKKWKLSDKKLNSIFYFIHKYLTENHYFHYEISNYAQAGKQSQHNQHYWKVEHYLGLGAYASGFIEDYRYQNYKIKNYKKKLLHHQFPYAFQEKRNKKDEFIETVFLGLRTSQGVPVELFSSPTLQPIISHYLDCGLLEKKEHRIVATLKGWTVLDSIIKKIVSVQ